MNHDPLTTDLWITPLMGAAHFYPKGSPDALCGFGWQSQTWNVETSKPDNCCEACDRAVQRRGVSHT
jgi:hypothetical protein